MYKLYFLSDKKPDKNWYCISCEKKVTSFNEDYSQDKILIPSYFIRVYPNNVRICKNCMAKSIKEGSEQ